MPPQALGDHLVRTADAIAGHAATRSIRGLSETGVRSGADRRQIIAEGGAKFNYPTEAFKFGTAKVLQNLAKLIKNVVPGDVRVWALHPQDGSVETIVKKDDLVPPFNVHVEFQPTSEEDEYRRHDDQIRRREAGLVSEEYVWSQDSSINPETMRRQKRKEEYRQLPSYIQALDQAVAIRTGLAAQQQAQPPENGNGEVPGGMVTNTRDVIVPGSAQDIQNKLAAQRGPSLTNQGEGGGGRRPQ